MRRTPLKSDPAKTLAWRRRSKGLARGAGPARKTRLKPVRAKQRKRNKVWREVTRQAIEQVKGVCPVKSEFCTTEATDGHHKRLRSQGGTDTLENCLPCCNGCHIHAIHGNHRWAVEMGYIVPKYASLHSPVDTVSLLASMAPPKSDPADVVAARATEGRDDDPEARQASLDRMDLNVRHR